MIGHPIEPLRQVVATIAGHAETHLSGDAQMGGDRSSPRPASKWAGVFAYCELAGIDSERVIAIGDGPNDMGLLTHAAIAVVPGAAFPEALSLADHVVPAPDAGGWAHVLHFV